MVHTCHAIGCPRPCPPEYLMCPAHWRQVPKRLQAAVYAAYAPGQCDLDPPPSDAWHQAADHAIAYVAVQEGRWPHAQANTRLARYGPRLWIGSPHGRRGPVDFVPTQAVYIGREMPGQAPSLLGKPVWMMPDWQPKYRASLQDAMTRQNDIFRELRRILYLSLRGGVVLSCWCAPKPCHGDIVAEAINALWTVGWRD